METRGSWPSTRTTKSHQSLAVRATGPRDSARQMGSCLHTHTHTHTQNYTHLCTTLTHTLRSASTEMLSCTYLYMMSMFSHTHTQVNTPFLHCLAFMHLQGHTDRCVHTHTTPLNNVLLYLCLKYSLSSASFYSATSHTLSSFLLHFVLNSSFLFSSLPSSFSNPSGLPVMWLLCFCWIKHRLGERERRREMKRNVDSEETERLRKKERSGEWKK